MGDAVTAREMAAGSACWFWSTRKIGPVADADQIAEVRRLVNGGVIGLEEVIALYGTAKAHLGAH